MASGLHNCLPTMRAFVVLAVIASTRLAAAQEMEGELVHPVLVDVATDPARIGIADTAPTHGRRPHHQQRAPRKSVTPFGLGVSLGGGVQEYRDLGTAGAYDARMQIGTRTLFGVEIAYVGSAQRLGGAGDASLLSNGAEALVRLNVPGVPIVRPFLFGGAAWDRYDVTSNGVAAARMRGSDDVLATPYGGGLARELAGGMLLDARFCWRPATHVDMTAGSLDSWSLTARLGYSF